ncbi:MAG: hypothetical protein AMS26_12960 [Bacteroides sp. SM23_62]|nr:MAG: hypothetical protein AMS26_12960 [Bacteroides sp. SM23_62]
MMRNTILLLVAAAMAGACSNEYYISPDGDDSNSGKSPANAWKTIQKVNETDFVPGSSILFEGGEEFEGTIQLSGADAGSAGREITISSYGEGRALIKGGDKQGLLATDCDFLVVRDLIFEGSGRKTGNTTDGILITGSDSVLLEKLEVYGFQKSGLHVRKSLKAHITHVYAHHNGFAGIHVTGATMNHKTDYDNADLYIGYCVAVSNPGDPTVLKNHSGNGILASSVKGGIIEYCEAFNNGWDMPWTGNGPVGIWIWDCTDFIIQYCIAHDNKTNPVAADGGGFDFDGGVSNSIMQYNLSYNNEGCGYGLYEFGAAKTWENNIIRYNISQDDGIINGGAVGIWKNDSRGTMRNCEIYNNTFYNSAENGPVIWLYDHYPGFRFRNNIFVYNGTFLDEGQQLEDEVFQGNVYWNLDGGLGIGNYETIEEWAAATGKEMINDELVGQYINPGLHSPGKTALVDPGSLDGRHLSEYIPVPGSPVIDAGLDLKELFNLDQGKRDILGTPIPSGKAYDIGAIEYQ